MYRAYETKDAKNDKALVLKSHTKATQSKLLYFINDILEKPRMLDTVGNPEKLKHTEKEIWSRELNKKDRIVYGIEQGSNYQMPEEEEIIVFFQYLGHYQDK